MEFMLYFVQEEQMHMYVCKYSKMSEASNYVISSNGAQIYDYEKI